MKKQMIKLTQIFLLVASFGFASLAQAAVTPLSVGLVPPLQFPPSDFSVTGVRASLLFGSHRDLYGIDIGVLGNITQQDFVGVGVSGAFNYTQGSTTVLGLQLAGLTNINKGKTNVYGLQLALGLNSNTAASKVVGLQLAAVNLSEFTDIYGLQAGIYNRANEVYGFQIGLLNFNQKGTFVVAPLLNVGF